MTNNKYKGDALKDKAYIDHISKILVHDDQGKLIKKKGGKEDIFPYRPSKELVDSVEMARLLNRPLLVRGAPGCGKTRLAQAVAFELHDKKDYRLNYFEWHIKSTSKAKEGLYQFDHLQRLRDLEIMKVLAAGKEGLKREDIEGDVLKKYRTFGPLGKAFITSKDKDKPSILLIDEIDKADLDFPNDLLLELDQKRFYIPETKEYIEAEEPPIIIITSNDEKDLPNAFLRRCIFHYIQFPNYKELHRIASVRLSAEISKKNEKEAHKLTQKEKDFLDEALERFKQIYKEMKDNANIDKVPSTSEMLDWVKALYFSEPSVLSELLEGKELSRHFYNTLIKSYNDQGLILGDELENLGE